MTAGESLSPARGSQVKRLSRQDLHALLNAEKEVLGSGTFGNVYAV